MLDWYYADAQNERQGPISAAELKGLLQNNTISMQTLVWSQGMLQWEALSEIFPVLLAAVEKQQKANNSSPFTNTLESTPNVSFAHSNNRIPLDKTTTFNNTDTNNRSNSELAANSRQLFSTENNDAPHSLYAAPQSQINRSNSQIYLDNPIVYAGFEKRLAAYIIDGFIINVIAFVFSFIISMIILMFTFFGARSNTSNSLIDSLMTGIQLFSYLINIAIYVAYYVYFHSSSKQATLGKMAVGIKVVKLDGEPLTLGQSFLRYLALFLSALPLGIGFIMAGFTEKKQGLHDIVCSTLVIDKWAFTEYPERQNPKRNIVAIIVNLLFILTIALVTGFAILMAMAVGGR